MSATMTAQLVTDALVMAIWRRGKPNTLLHHSDRGNPTRRHSTLGYLSPIEFEMKVGLA
jgi:transposase InsO family protein